MFVYWPQMAVQPMSVNDCWVYEREQCLHMLSQVWADEGSAAEVEFEIQNVQQALSLLADAVYRFSKSSGYELLL